MPEFVYTERYVVPGGAGANDGTSWTDAWDISQVEADITTGKRFNFSGQFTSSSKLNWRITTATRAAFVGWTADKSELATTVDTMPTIDFTSMGSGWAVDTYNYQYYQGLYLKNGPDVGFANGGEATIFNRCVVDNFASYGYSMGNLCKLLQCVAMNMTGSQAIHCFGNTEIYGCYVSGAGIFINERIIHFTTIYNCAKAVFGYFPTLAFNTIDSCTVGIDTQSRGFAKIGNNITNCATGVSGGSHASSIELHNNFFGNTLNHASGYTNAYEETQYNEDPGYTNLANRDASMSNKDLQNINVSGYGSMNIGSWQGTPGDNATSYLLVGSPILRGIR